MTRSSEQQQGRLVRWNDERGFGFIQPEDGSADVFLHISALKRASRRPRDGDVIFYDVTTGSTGKQQAANARIQGVAPKAIPPKSHQPAATRRRPAPHPSSQRTPTSPRRQSGRLKERLIVIPSVALTALVGVLIASQILNQPGTQPPLPQTLPQTLIQPDCLIKGNISQTSGRKWYHLPGMEDYENTVIDPAFGERWFCTEEEAIQSGWQKAPK